MAECSGKAPDVELPAERDQGLRAWIRERTHRPLEHPCGPGCSRVGWTSGTTRDTEAHGPGNDSAGGNLRRAWRQALGGSEGLSFMR